MRRKDREIKDLDVIKELVESCKVCRLGMVDNGLPYIVPINYGHQFIEDKLTLYFHSAKIGRKIDILKTNPKVCIEMDDKHELVGEGDIACVYGYYFASLIGMGEVTEVVNEVDKKQALELLMEDMTGRKGYLYDRLDTIKVYKVELHEYSVKARQMDKKSQAE